MYPGFHSWWRVHHDRHGGHGLRGFGARGSGWVAHAVWREACGPGAGDGTRGFEFSSRDETADVGSTAFGVKRPLRFLAFKLGLDDRQVGEMARILDDLKTERAQAEVDRRRTVAAFADSIAGASYDAARAAEGAALRVQSAERLRDAVLRALGRIHAVLDEEQRSRLAYLVRTGSLQI
jgi:LTXXQ motif family protein